ncbi:hypothetical protein ACLOJK_011984 [Asimina triloba]
MLAAGFDPMRTNMHEIASLNLSDKPETRREKVKIDTSLLLSRIAFPTQWSQSDDDRAHGRFQEPCVWTTANDRYHVVKGRGDLAFGICECDSSKVTIVAMHAFCGRTGTT